MGDRRRARRARLRVGRPRPRPGHGRQARAGSSPAGCSSSTPSTAGSSATRRSSPRSPSQHPYDEWLHAGLIELEHLPEREHVVHTASSVARRQQTFGYTAGGAAHPADPDGQERRRGRSARWAPTRPIAVLSSRPRLLFDYFTQLFAQVTNPPLDAIREELVTSLGIDHRPGGQRALGVAGARAPARAAVPGHRQRRARQDRPHQRRRRPARVCDVRGPRPLRGQRRRRGDARPARGDLRSRCPQAIRRGARFVVLSDRDSGRDLAPIPSLLLTSAVHHHLIREKTRTQVGLLVEAGDVREVHHVALLIGYGAAAVNPYLAMESVEDLVRVRHHHRCRPGEGRREPHQGARQGRPQGDVEDGHLDRGVLPRRPGVRGDRPVAAARRPLLHRHRRRQLGGVDLDVVAEEVAARHAGGLPARGHPPGAPQAGGRRRVPVAARGRAAPVRPRDGVPAPARHPGPALRHLQAVHRPGRRAVGAADDAARAVRVRARRRDRPPGDPASRRSSRSARSSSGSAPAR